MPAKRAASKPAASPSKAPKVARIEPEVDHFLVAAAPVLELLAKAESLSQDCREMLQSSALFSLRTPKGERHAYQNTMIEAISKVAEDVEGAHQAAVVASQADVDEIAASKETAAAHLVAAQEAVDASSKESTEKAEAVQAALEAVHVAQKAVTEAAARVGSLESEKAEAIAEKVEYENLLSETFESLKQGTVAGHWSNKQKLATVVVEMLDKVGLDASLKGALPVALKAKPAERGPFALKAIEFGEELLAKHIAALTAKLAGFDAEAELRAKAAADAESALTEKNTVLEEKKKEHKDAKAVLHEKEGVLSKAKRDAKALEPRGKEAATNLAKTQAALTSVKELVAKYEELLKGFAPPVAADAVAEASEPAAVEAAEAPEAAGAMEE